MSKLSLEQIQTMQQSLESAAKKPGAMQDDETIAFLSEDGSQANATARAVDKAIVRRRMEEGRRGHLGMSQIGAEDPRTIWLNWRWCLPMTDDARKLRIFEIGNAIEDLIVERLKNVTEADVGRSKLDKPAFEIFDRDPRTNGQIRFSDWGGHFAGSADGFIKGLPESPNKWHVLEVKSAKDSRFKEFKALGIQKTAPEYFAQLQCYMHYGNVDRALWVCENKDTSELLFYRIKAQPAIARAMRSKAERLLRTDSVPESIYPSRNYFEIKSYKSEEYQAIYWGDELPKKNCRNCQFSCPILDQSGGKWVCKKNGNILSLADQHQGCGDHTWLLSLTQK